MRFNNEVAFEVKEIPSGMDLKHLQYLSAKIGVTKFRIIGRYPSPNIDDYIWGGDIR